MRFFTASLTAITSLVALVAAIPQNVPAAVPSATGVPALSTGANPITYPLGLEAIQAGKSITIKWSPNYGDAVTLNLRKGSDVNNLDLDSKIASEIPNTGSYTWTVPKSLDGTTYAIEIISGNAANYSPQFEVNATGKQGDAKPESVVLKPASATIAPSARPTGASNSTISISKSIDSAKASASASATGTKTVPSGAPTAVAGDSASSKTQGSIIAVMVGLMAAVALLN